MKRALLLITVLFLNTLVAQEKPKTENRLTAAVLDFKIISGITDAEVTALTSKFRSSLIQTKKYDVLERGQMETILKEQDFSLSDNCNSAECAVQVGQLLAAEKMITGDIGKIGSTYTVTVRIIDVSTGKIEDTQSSEYRGDTDGLIKTFDLLAQKLTGVYRSKATLWYIMGGTALAGGAAAAVLLLSGSKSGTSATIGNPPGAPLIP
ncbi:DUF2380 domain-containing protein [bacterium]|nr:MAG: DUF2380 domain-containing protein [bacterium]